MPPPALELRKVSKSYREGEAEREVLRDVSVTITRGEIIVLVGRSGSGKSTLLNVIAGIDRPTAGSVIVDGTDLTALDEQARTRFRRRHIGFVFQFYNLIPLLTVEENLMLPLDLNGRADAKGIARASRRAAAAHASVAARAGHPRHRARRGRRRVHRPRQRQRAPRVRTGHRGGERPGDAPDPRRTVGTARRPLSPARRRRRRAPHRTDRRG